MPASAPRWNRTWSTATTSSSRFRGRGEIRNIPEIARGHHEKMNGKGYPGNLASQEIPLATRMMTIADIFDALAAADRPYKAAVSVERALEILGEMARRRRDRSRSCSRFCAGQGVRALEGRVLRVLKLRC